MMRLNINKEKRGLFHIDHSQCGPRECEHGRCADPLLGLFRWASGQSFYEGSSIGPLQRHIDVRGQSLKGCFDYFQRLYFAEYYPARNLIRWCHYSKVPIDDRVQYCDLVVLEKYKEDDSDVAYRVPDGFLQDELTCSVFNLLLDTNMSQGEKTFMTDLYVEMRDPARLKYIVVPDLTDESRRQYNLVAATMAQMNPDWWTADEDDEVLETTTLNLIGSPSLYQSCMYWFELVRGPSTFEVNDSSYAYMARAFLQGI